MNGDPFPGGNIFRAGGQACAQLTPPVAPCKIDPRELVFRIVKALARQLHAGRTIQSQGPRPSGSLPYSSDAMILPMAFVRTLGTQFRLDDRAFYFAGANNYYLAYKSNFMVDALLDSALALGLNVIRTWGFLDMGSLDGSVPSIQAPGPKEGIYFHYWDPVAGAPAYND